MSDGWYIRVCLNATISLIDYILKMRIGRQGQGIIKKAAYTTCITWIDLSMGGPNGHFSRSKRER